LNRDDSKWHKINLCGITITVFVEMIEV